MKTLSALVHTAFLSAFVHAQGQDEPISHRVRRLKERAESNREKLKRDYYENHGQVLTDDVIDAAIQDARDRAGERWSEDNKPRLTRRIRGLEEYYDREHREIVGFGDRGGDTIDEPDLENERSAEKDPRAVAETIAFREGVLVSGASPGWSWNCGRNEFWCVAIPGLEQTTVPNGPTPMTLVNCATTSRPAVILDYTDDYEILMLEADRVFSDWCLESTRYRRSGEVEVAKCDIAKELQQWRLIEDDDTWRLKADINLCVQAGRRKMDNGWTPPDSSCPGWSLEHDSITLSLNCCATEIGFGKQPTRRLGKNKHKTGYNECSRKRGGNSDSRKGQVFIYCFRATVCSGSVKNLGCTEIESCDI